MVNFFIFVLAMTIEMVNFLVMNRGSCELMHEVHEGFNWVRLIMPTSMDERENFQYF